MNLNTENYEYRLGETYRQQLRDAAARQRLAGNLRPQRKGFALAVVVVLLVVLLIPHFIASAQDRTASDPGVDIRDAARPVSYRLGNYYMMTGDYPQAIAQFNETIEQFPDFGYAYAGRGDGYAALGQYEQAIADYTQAIAIFPDYASAHYTRGLAYAAQNRVTEAALDFNTAIALVPDYSLPYRALGDVYYTHGDFANALSSYHTYLSLEDTPAIWIVERTHELEVRLA